MNSPTTPAPADLRLARWRQWGERCALSLCDEETAGYLAAFVDQRFLALVTRLDKSQLPPAANPPIGWSYFEETMRAGRRLDGKLYKHHLLEELRPHYARQADDIESYVSRVMRTVARHYCVGEHLEQQRRLRNGVFFSSADAESETTLDTESPDFTAAMAEIEKIALSLVPILLPRLTQRQLAVLRATAHGQSLDNPEVLREAGCAKTQAYAAREQAADLIAIHVQSTYRDEDPSAVAALLRFTAKALLDVCGGETGILPEKV